MPASTLSPIIVYRLSYAPVKVIATTSQSILLLDCLNGCAEILHRGAGLYYGVTRIGKSYAVAARRRLVSSSIPRTDERGCILIFNRCFRIAQVLEAPFPLRDIHEIAWFDNRLWVTCSFDDMIATFDGSLWERWYPLELPQNDVKDRYHYNSFFVTADEVALLAHNHGPSDLHFFDRYSRSRRRSLALGNQAHNIWIDDTAYATCSSIDGKLISTSGWELFTGGFPRGVCLGTTYRAIGISALSERGQRDWASAAIALYDSSWHPLHYVHLLREGMILDIAPISEMESIAIEEETGERLRFPLLSELTDADLVGT